MFAGTELSAHKSVQAYIRLDPGVQMKRSMANILVQSLLVVLVASAIGFATNAVRGDGLRFFEPAQQTDTAFLKRIDLDQAKDLFDAGQAIFLDSRDPHLYRQGHITGAKNLPLDQYEEEFDELLGLVSLDSLIVTYCSGEDCHSSNALAQRLGEDGFTRLHVFFSGWPAWVAAGHPVVQEKSSSLFGVDE